MTRLSKRDFLTITAAAAVAGPPRLGADTPRLMEGPMVGHVTPTSVLIWARAAWPVPVAVEYDVSPSFTAPKRTAPVMPGEAGDMTVHIPIEGLRPATTYYYRMLVDGRVDRYQDALPEFPVRTAPAAGWRGRFSIAIGSCARMGQDPAQPVWHAVRAAAPDLFFWMGDNIYADSSHEHVFAEEYRRQRAQPLLQPLLRTVPQLAIWDDHDFGVNDGDGSNPAKDVALRQFKRYWANPAYGTDAAPGVFFKYSYGGIDCFFVDCRYHRDPNEAPDSPAKTMLGAAQLAWLKEGLQASRAPFKLLISGSGWSAAKGHGGDSWASYITERNALFEFIHTRNIPGVVLLSGDTHVGELNCIPWSDKGGYDLYDLVSSPLAQRTERSWMERNPERRIRQPFFHDSNFGLLVIDTAGDGAGEATLSYNVYDTRGREAWAPLVLKASDLKNGIASWAAKMDPLSRQRYERWTAGGPYYGPL